MIWARIRPGIEPLQPEYRFFAEEPLADIPMVITGVRVHWGSASAFEDVRFFLSGDTSHAIGDPIPQPHWILTLTVAGRTILESPVYNLPSMNQISSAPVEVKPGGLTTPQPVAAGEILELILRGPAFTPSNHQFEITVIIHAADARGTEEGKSTT